jgi:hypothetical protein
VRGVQDAITDDEHVVVWHAITRLGWGKGSVEDGMRAITKLGVSASGKKRWQAIIRYGGTVHHLGYFDKREDAALAYETVACECGEDS